MWKYEHIDETRQRLLAKGTIDLSGPTDEAMALYVRDCLMILITNDCPDIKVIISSDGGNVLTGIAIYDILKSYPGKITGIVLGFCRSFGMVVLQACTERLALPHAILRIHDVLVDIQQLRADVILDRVQFDEFYDDLAKGVRADQELINNIYCARSGQPLGAIVELSGEDRNLTAQEALDLGLIDRIVEKI